MNNLRKRKKLNVKNFKNKLIVKKKNKKLKKSNNKKKKK